MATRTVVLTADQGLPRDKTAMLTLVTPKDRALTPEGWRTASEMTRDQAVQQVEHFERHTSALGDVLIVEDAAQQPIAQVQIVQIRYVHCADLADEDIRALGFSTRADYDAQWSGRSRDYNGWLINIEHLTARGGEPSDLLH